MITELPTSFEESLRYTYDLTPDSLVIDCGFHKGTFTKEMVRRYNCWIEAYEPIEEFYRQGKNIPGKINLVNAGVGAINQMRTFKIKGDSTGFFAGEGKSERVSIKAIRDVALKGCDVLKLNIEGMEFEVLESMLDRDLAVLCQNIQVQFHPIVPDFQSRYEAIRSKLLETHHLTFDFPWCWQNFRINYAN